MQKLNYSHSAMMGGVILSGLHFFWSILVATGLGQMYFDFIMWTHMIHMEVQIGPFDFVAFLTLMIFTFVVGYVIGWLFAYCWNKISK